MNGKNYTFYKSIPCSFGWRPMTTTTTANRWQNVFHSSSHAITECLNGILGHTRSKCLQETNNWARFFKCTFFFFKRITCFQLISLIIRPTQWNGLVCAAILKSTVLRVEVSFCLHCGSIFLLPLSLSIANNDVFM